MHVGADVLVVDDGYETRRRERMVISDWTLTRAGDPVVEAGGQDPIEGRQSSAQRF